MAKVNDSFLDQLGRSPQVVALVNAKRDAVAAVIRATGPEDTRDYKRGIVTRGKIQNRRYVGLVVGTDKKTLLIESKLGVMARALRTVARG